MTRIPLLLVMPLLATMLAACGNDAPADDSDSDNAANGAFPVTVETEFGDVTVEEEPERIVALGWGDAETALALGVQPVGASDWLEFGGDGVGPWLEGAYDEPPTMINTLDPGLEQLAALEPDLILDVNSSGEQERHDTLSQVAPVVGVPPGATNYGTSWRDQVTTVASVLGQADKGKQLVGEVEDEFKEQAAAYPEFEGKTIALAARTSEGWGAYVERDQRVQFAEALGFVNSPAIEQRADDDFSIDVSEERLDLFDADLTVAMPIDVDESMITEDPLFGQVQSVDDNRLALFDNENVRLAFSTGTVPALRYALEKVPPVFAEALNS